MYILFFLTVATGCLETGARGRGAQILAPVFPGWNSSSTDRSLHFILILLKLHLSQQRKPGGCSAFSEADWILKRHSGPVWATTSSPNSSTPLKLARAHRFKTNKCSKWVYPFTTKYYLALALLKQIRLHPHDQIQAVHWCIRIIKSFPPPLFSIRCI